MENLNATASLTIAVDTTQANENLNTLEQRITKLGAATAGGTAGIAKDSPETQRKLAMLEAEVAALTDSLHKNKQAKEALSRVTKSWSAAEGAARISFRENAKLSGDQVRSMAQEAERLKQSLRGIKMDNLGLDSLGQARVQLVGRIKDTFKAAQSSAVQEGRTTANVLKAQVAGIQQAFEGLFKDNRVSSNRMKSLVEVLTTQATRGDAQFADLKAQLAQQEAAGRLYDSLKQKSEAWATASSKARAQAVAALTAENEGTRAITTLYRSREEAQQQKEDGRARAELAKRNQQLLEQQERSHLSTIAEMRRSSAKSLAESSDEGARTKLAKRNQQLLEQQERSHLSTIAEMRRNSVDSLKLGMSTVFETAKDSADGYNALGKRVFAAKALVDQFGEAQARAFLGKGSGLVDRISELDKLTNSAKIAAASLRDLKRVQSASISYSVATDRQKAMLDLRAGTAMARGYDLSGYAPEALAAAQAAGGVAALQQRVKDLTPDTRQLTGANRLLNESMKELHTGARGVAGAFGQLWMTYGSLVPLLTGAALGAAFRSTFQKGAEFEYQLTFVKALGGESAAAVEKLSAAALDLGKNGLYGPIEVAKGLRILAQAGLNAREQLVAIPQVLDLATVGEMGVDAAAEAAIGIATAFGKTKLQVQEVGDVIAKAAAVSQTSVSSIAESMKYASVVGEQYSVSLEDTAAALAALARLNITGTAAGTAFRNMVKELYAPTGEATKAFKLLGLQTKDSQGNLRDMTDILFDLKTALEPYNKGAQTEILQKMFGERGAKPVVEILSQTREEWNKLRADVADSRGFMGQVAAELEATTSGTMKQAFNTLEASIIEVFNTSKYGMGEMAADLKSLFGSEEFKQTVASFVQVTLSAAQALIEYKDVIVAIAEGYVIGKIALAVDALSLALRGSATAAAAAAGATGLGAVAGVGGRVAAALAPLAGPAGIVAGVAAGLLLIWSNAQAGESAAVSFSGSVKRMNEALDRQYDKLVQSNEAMRERIRLAKGQPEAAQNTPAGTVAAKEAELRKLVNDYNNKVKDLKSRGFYAGNLNPELRRDREAILAAQADLKNSRETVNKIAGAAIDESVNRGVAEQAERDEKQASLIQKLIAQLRESKKAGAQKYIVQLEEGGVLFGDTKAAQEFLDMGKKALGADPWKESRGGSKRGETTLRNAQVTDIETQVRSLLDTYKRAEESFKGQAKDYVMAYPDAIAKSLDDLEKTKAKADQMFGQANDVAGKDPAAKARVNATQQRFNSEYLKEKQALNRELLDADRKYAEAAEKALVDLGAKSLGAQEVFRRKFMNENGNLLKDVWARMDSADPQVAEAATRLNEELLKAFDLGSVEAKVSANITTMSRQIESYRAQLSTVMKADQDGGLLAALFGTSAQISGIKASMVAGLQESLSEVEALIRDWNGDPERKLQLISKRDELKAQLEEAINTVSPSIKDLADTLGNGIANSITNGFKAGENPGRTFARNIGDAIKKSITKALADVISKQITVNLTAMLSGQGGSGVAAGASGGVLGAVSNVAGLGNLAAKTGMLSLGSLGSTFSGGMSATMAGGGGVALEGAAAMIGEAGSVAGVLQGVAQGLGAVAPYLVAATFVAQQLGAFKGPTYHKGGAYMSGTDGSFTKATNANLPDFNLGWGAYNSDRMAGFDDAMLAMSGGLAKQLQESVKRYGGKTDTLKVGTRFASDNDDWSEGAIRILDEAGNRVFDFTKRYTKDSSKAMQEFGEDSVRALLATLQKTDLTDEYDTLFKGLDPLKASITEINALLQQAEAIQQQVATVRNALDANFLDSTERVNKVFADLDKGVPQSKASYEALARAQDLNTAAGRNMAAALLDAYSMWEQASNAVQAIKDSIAESFVDPAVRLQGAFDKLSQTLPSSVAGFQTLVESQDLNTAAGREMASALMELYPLWQQVSGAAGSAANSAEERLQLEKQLLELQGRTNELRAIELKSISEANKRLQLQVWAFQDMDVARNDLISSYQDEVSSLQSVIDKFKDFSKDLRKFRDDLKLGELSPLTPGQKYGEARAQFDSIYTKAMSGDETALGQLQGAATEFLNASKVYNASGGAYIADFSKVQEALSNSAISAEAAADVSTLQLNAAKAQLDKLGSIDTKAKTIADNIATLASSIVTLIRAGGNPGINNVAALTGGTTGSWVKTQAGQEAYQSTAGAAAVKDTNGEMAILDLGGKVKTPGELTTYWKSGISDRQIYDSAKETGITLGELDSLMNWPTGTSEEWARAQGLPVFARGGYYKGGMALVGEEGPELINFSSPGTVYNAKQTQQMLASGGSGNLEALVQRLVEEVSQLRAQQRDETGAIIQSQYQAAVVGAEHGATNASRSTWIQQTKPQLV